MSREVLVSKVQRKQQDLEDSLTLAFKEGSISYIEHSNKLKRIRDGAREIEQAILSD